ncbi:FGGY-family carbohydrate kinase [Niabella aquatica]
MKQKTDVIAVFDIGKTNKKLLLFDEKYNLVEENIITFDEISDDDGFPCEDINALEKWVLSSFDQLKKSTQFQLRAINFSTYGASLVYIDAGGSRVGYLYNYLKPYPPDLMQRFIAERGGSESIMKSTSTPLTGHLNAGLQLYWLKHERPEIFKKVHTALHLPQYLNYLITGCTKAEITSLGCHSAMWNFAEKKYHQWLDDEAIKDKLAEVIKGDTVTPCKNEYTNDTILVGSGLHDSSAALIPYLFCFDHSFMVLSTGTWVISLNPFSSELPTAAELGAGCLSYLSYKGSPVKTTMLFSGNDHQQQTQRIADYFNVDQLFYQSVKYESNILNQLDKNIDLNFSDLNSTMPSPFSKRDIRRFNNAEAAYHQLLIDLVAQQAASARMVLTNSNIGTIYVDGGFCKNEIYMQLLSEIFSDYKVYTAAVMQGAALGAALAIHKHWNLTPVAPDMIQLKAWNQYNNVNSY